MLLQQCFSLRLLSQPPSCGTIEVPMRRNLRPSYVVCGFLVWLSAIIVFPPVVFAQASNSLDTQHRKGEAYRLFILGRYFERSGDLDSAIESYRNAASLDLETGEILAELSSLYARQNEPAEATAVRG